MAFVKKHPQGRHPQGRYTQARLLSQSMHSRWGLPLIIALLTCLIITSKLKPEWIETVSRTTNDIVTPIFSLLSNPVVMLDQASQWVEETWYLRTHYAAMEAELAELKQKEVQLSVVLEENKGLRALIPAIPRKSTQPIAAQLVAISSGPYSRTATINAGSIDGIARGQAVINPSGLIGRIIEVGHHSARVMLTANINSRIPVIGEKSRAVAIAAGNNDALTITFNDKTNSFIHGERILTSGDGETFAPNILVGKYMHEANAKPYIEPTSYVGETPYIAVISHR